ncbi:hypothetical protein BURMUCGD2M_5563 [Burkholderia multivorans CGD2M]|uniref:Uncharacterized protein n=1 Tax=Burkholderia multivorans CGD2 TaxID=513052 RepID=B9BKG4_9BURK|nr:hypothetical protein BURMUCGD2_5572 [Burkholderia multivorans CGD2]EEE16118.1 hypothetical protein BURMUCGD2M_5563 [Burkholderia multivorans CGD2M]
MPRARLTDARRLRRRAPAYGARTYYLPDTNHGHCPPRGARRRLPMGGERTRPRATHADGKAGFDCRRYLETTTST